MENVGSFTGDAYQTKILGHLRFEIPKNVADSKLTIIEHI